MAKHQKHAKLARPSIGEFHRNEWAILGTPCGEIKSLARKLMQDLGSEWNIAYVDADHQSADKEAETGKDLSSALAYGANMEFTDKITFNRFDLNRSLNSFEQKPFFQSQDAVLVNGNHFPAKEQMIVIDPRKPLEKKLHKLTGVRLILLQEGVEEIPGYIKAHLPDFDAIPVMKLGETASISDFLKENLKVSVAPLKGLILAGGKSQRMGKDKANLIYHGKPQHAYLLDVFGELHIPTWLSCREDQASEFENHDLITDTFTGLGPYGAILSAFRQDPDAAWLVVAVDLPLLDKAALEHLIENRNSSKVATAFNSPDNEFPEPLIAIWEPRSYPSLLQFLSLGYSCPRKVLINSDIHRIDAIDSKVLTNVNLPGEYDKVIKQLNKA